MLKPTAPTTRSDRARRETPGAAPAGRIGATPATSAVDPAVLARARDDRLGILLARACRRRRVLSNPLLQRVGEAKAGYTVADAAPADKLELLKVAFATIRSDRKKKKDDFQRDTLDKMVNEEWNESRRREAMKEYTTLLTFANWATQLQATEPFTSGALQLVDGNVITGDADRKLVATLTQADAMFTPTANPVGERAMFLKAGGQSDRMYVADDRQVQTRRYAFVEKSIYQFMHFATTASMTGRFQLLREQVGIKAASITTVKGKLKQMLTPASGRAQATAELTPEEVAVLHQYKGSGPQQRGLSLVSTPRESALFSNEGTRFASTDGVRMKIDLAKVPANVRLLNHYSARGVKDLKAWKPEGYDYGASVQKNRELYLERLDADWVVDAVPRKANKALDKTGLSGKALVDAVSASLAVDEYLAGYRATLGLATDTASATTWAKDAGIRAGEHYAAGFKLGKAWRDKAPANPSEDAIWIAMNEQYSKVVKLRHPDDYFVGWVHGAFAKTKGSHLPEA